MIILTMMSKFSFEFDDVIILKKIKTGMLISHQEKCMKLKFGI